MKNSLSYSLVIGVLDTIGFSDFTLKRWILGEELPLIMHVMPRGGDSGLWLWLWLWCLMYKVLGEDFLLR